MNQHYIRGVRLSTPVEKNSYLQTLPAVQALATGPGLEFTRDVTFFVGENGTGKSTLLEAIAVAYGFNAEGGSRNFSFSTKSTHSGLCNHLTLSRGAVPRDGFFLRAESFYNAASYLDELDEGPLGERLLPLYGGVSLHDQSHGESFLALVRNRFRGRGLYILDEPEAALSPSRLLSLLVCLHDLVENHSQFLIATHSPILMAYPGAQILQLSDQGIAPVAYRDTEHYQLTRRFLEDPEGMMHRLFEEDEP